MRTVEYKLPDYLASYLINGDSSGLDEDELSQFNEWLTNENIGHCLDIVESLGFCRTNDYHNLGTDCSLYSFTC